MAPQTKKIKAVFFDFMGTCLDWHSTVVSQFPLSIPGPIASQIALEWRRQYFLDNEAHHKAGKQNDLIDVVLHRTLNLVLAESSEKFNTTAINDTVKTQLVEAWHRQRAWPEVGAAIDALREKLGCEVFVHANGTTRLQLDLVRSSGLRFNMLFSSQLLGLLKPAPEAYQRALDYIGLPAEEVVLVAAHAYDLRGAAAVGIRTVYIRRWTDDIHEDMAKVEKEFDAFLYDMSGLPEVIAKLD